MFKNYHIKLECQPMWLGLENTPTASLQQGNTPHNEYPGYDIKQSDGEASVLKLWEMDCTPSLL